MSKNESRKKPEALSLEASREINMKRKKTKPEPGRILRYRSRSRHAGEILCHNHVIHHEAMAHGMNGFRYFVCARGGGWTVCPRGWRPELGVHYATPDHVRWWRETGLKQLREGKLWRRMFPHLKPGTMKPGA